MNIKMVRIWYFKTRYELECNNNLKLDFPMGRTTVKPVNDICIISEHFSRPLALSRHRGLKLFISYKHKKSVKKDNSIWKMIIEDKVNFNFDGLFYELLGFSNRIFEY